MVPTGHLVGAVGDEGGSVGAPALVGNHILTDGEEGGEGQQLIPVGNSVVEGHNDGLVVSGFHSQVIGIALDTLEHVAVVRTQSGRSGTLPGKGKVRSSQVLAVRPLEAVLQGVGVGHGAVVVGHAFRQVGSAVGNDFQVALVVGVPLGQACEQVAVQGRTVNSGVEGRIDNIRLGGDADGDGVGVAVHVSLVEVLVAQGVAEEAVDGIIQHVDVGVEVQRNDAAGVHQHILGNVHHGIAVVLVGAALDGGNQHIIGLGPGAVFNLGVQAIGGQVQAVGLDSGVVALAELNVIVAGDSDPHIQEADGVIVVGNPAVTGNGVVAGLPGVQEGVPLLVFQVHGDAHTSQNAGQVLTDGLVALIGVVQVGQSGEVGELAGGLIVVIVLRQGGNGLLEVGFISILGNIPVAVKAVVVTGVLVELGAVGIGHAHGNEGGSGNLTGLGDLVDDVVAVIEQGDGVTDLRLGGGLFFRGHVAGVHFLNSGGFGLGCGGGGIGGGGSGGLRAGGRTTGSHAQDHSGSQKQCKQFLHFSLSFLQ